MKLNTTISIDNMIALGTVIYKNSKETKLYRKISVQ